MSHCEDKPDVRVLLAYHAAGMESSRRMFEAVGAHSGIRLRVLGPRRGFNRARNVVVETPTIQEATYDMVSGRVMRAMRNFWNPYWTGLLREIRCFKPHIIHVFNEPFAPVYLQALLYRRLFLPSARCVCTAFENGITPASEDINKVRAYRIARRYGDGVACCSQSARQALMTLGFPDSSLAVTYWGIPIDRVSSGQNISLRKKLGYDGKFVLGYVGRLNSEKGLLTLLHALRHLPSHVVLLCVGDGPWRDDLFRHADKYGLRERVTWVARIPEDQVKDHMQAMDALILPSETTQTWREQFGRVLPEAMTCGLPIIGSDSGAIPDVVGDAGLIFAERDSYELVARVTELMTDADLRCRLQMSGQRRAQDLFSCLAYADRLVALYRGLLTHERPA